MSEEAKKELDANQARSLAELNDVLNSPRQDYSRISNALAEAKSYGAVGQAMSDASSFLIDTLTSRMNDAIARSDHVFTVHYFLEEGQKQGAPASKLADGWAAYQSMMTSGLTNELNAGHLRAAYDMLQHARLYGRPALDATIATSETRLAALSSEAITGAQELSQTDRPKLEQAIQVARAEMLEIATSEASETLNFETARVGVLGSIGAAVEAGNPDILAEVVTGAKQLGVTDPEVESAAALLKTLASQRLADTMARVPRNRGNATDRALTEVVSPAGDSEIERAMTLGKVSGLDELELAPAREVLTQHAREKVVALKAKKIETGRYFWELDDLQTAVNSRYLTKDEQAEGKIVMDNKLLEILTDKVLPINAQAEVLEKACSKDRQMDEEVLSAKAQSLEADLARELEAASAALDTQKLRLVVEAGGKLAGIAGQLKIEVAGINDNTNKASVQLQVAERRDDTMVSCEVSTHERGVVRLEKAVAAARAAGWPEDKLAPFVQQISERKQAIADARAQIMAALGGFGDLGGLPDLGGGRRLADDGNTMSAEALQTQLAPLQNLMALITKKYPDIVADGDPYLDKLSAKIESLQQKLDKLR